MVGSDFCWGGREKDGYILVAKLQVRSRRLRNVSGNDVLFYVGNLGSRSDLNEKSVNLNMKEPES